MNKKHKTELALTITILITLTLIITLQNPSITGLITGTGTTETININQTFTGNNTIETKLESITSLRITGNTTGETKIWLNTTKGKLLIYETPKEAQRRASILTGRVTGTEPKNETTSEEPQENKTVDEPEEITEETEEEPINETTPKEHVDIPENDTLQEKETIEIPENETIEIPENITDPVNETINITDINDTINVTQPVNETIEENITKPINETIETIIEFNEECQETCSLTPLNTTSIIIKTTENITVHIENIIITRTRTETRTNITQIPNQIIQINETLTLDLSEYMPNATYYDLSSSPGYQYTMNESVVIINPVKPGNYTSTAYAIIQEELETQEFNIQIIGEAPEKPTEIIRVGQPIISTKIILVENQTELEIELPRNILRLEAIQSTENETTNIEEENIRTTTRTINEIILENTEQEITRLETLLEKTPENTRAQLEEAKNNLEQRKNTLQDKIPEQARQRITTQTNEENHTITITEINPEATSITITYETEPPLLLVEEETNTRKIVTITSETHYENILAFTDIPSTPQEKILLYHLTGEGRKKVETISYVDETGDGLIERIEWIVPHLSSQTYEIIIITDAQHLDSEREFITNIYEELRELDDVWSPEIQDGEYVRVTFERELTSSNDITVYPRIISGNPRIEIYEENKGEIVAEFTSLNEYMYNKVYLTGLQGTQDTFDLLVLGGSVQFDHIIDPPPAEVCENDVCTVTITIPESSTWQVPLGVTEIQVEVWGGGGGGRAASGTNAGGGGGGGAYSRKNISVEPGTNFSYEVGAGGTSGNPGGDTWFNSSTSVMAKGGGSGSANTVGATGGAEGSGHGDTKFSGGNGGEGASHRQQARAGGGGGSSAGTSTNGGDGGAASGNTPGSGGTAPSGGGDGGAGGAGGNSGQPGNQPGGGGGGAGKDAGNTGGTGGNGTIIITYADVDVTKPTYSDANHSTNIPGIQATFSVQWNDNKALHPSGQYIFSTNNSGVWINDSAVNFTSTPELVETIKTLNDTIGVTIGYKWYATDNAGNANETIVYTLTTEEDTTPPTYTSASHSSVTAGIQATFSVQWNDNGALHPTGQYTFSTNNTGEWVDEDPVNFTTTPSWANVTMTLNDTVGLTVGYRWNATDNAGNPNETGIFTLITEGIFDCFNNASDPIPVCTCLDLNRTRENLSANYQLQNDINCNNTVNWNSFGWLPIGSPDTSFSGEFDGQGYVISDLYIHRSSTSYVGLFRQVSGVVKNVVLVNPNVTGQDRVGALTGSTASNSVVDGVFIINGSVEGTAGMGRVGGLVGHAGAGTINNSYSSSNILQRGDASAGGLVGAIFGAGSGLIENSYSEGSVDGTAHVGGLIGWTYDAMVLNSYSNASVTGTNDNFGGLVGYVQYASVAVPFHINRSYASGSVKEETTYGRSGGLIGRTTTEITVLDSFWDNQTTGHSTSWGSGGQTGKTTAEMKSIFTYNDTATTGLDEAWDIVLGREHVNETWFIDDGNDYPRLGWEEFVSPHTNISFTTPTPDHDETISVTESLINVSINTTNLDTFKFNWNNTNYTLYDESLVLMMNFDNRSELGENSSFVYDASMYENHGEIIGATWTTEGKYNKALEFDGASNYVDLNERKTAGKEEITISMWINPSSCSNTDTIFDESDGAYWQYSIRCDYWYTRDSSTGPTGSRNNDLALPTLQTQAWTHLTFVYSVSQSTKSIYLNGKLETNTSTSIDQLTTEGSNSWIGRPGDGTYFDGKIDEVRIWNRSLSEEEIWQVYQSNLYKYDTDKWQFTSNQSNLSIGTYDYYAYAKNVYGVENQTETRTLNVGDETPPKYTSASHSSVVAGEQATFSVLWDDDFALHPGGQWTFSTNNTGEWVNDSSVNFTSTPGWANVTKTLNDTINVTVGYKWYATDNAGNENETETFSLITSEVGAITNCDDLQDMNENLTMDYYLTQDIDCSATSTWNNGEGFIPIGNNTAGYRFTGTFDGQGYKINNLYISRSSTDYQALFGYTNTTAVIENVVLENVSITGNQYTAGLAGRSLGNISNVHLKGSVTATHNNGGGVTARNEGVVSNSSFNGSISGAWHTGGVVGDNQGHILHSHSHGTVSGASMVGGLAGRAGNSGPSGRYINDSYSTAYVSGSNFVGGLVGYQYMEVSIYNSYATGNVSGSSDAIGGLVGRGYQNVYYSYAMGNVTGRDMVGGLHGEGRKIHYSYASGNVEGRNEVGGLSGRAHQWDSTTNSYATGNVTGNSSIGGLIGYINSNHAVSNSYSIGFVNGSFDTGGLIGSKSDTAGDVTNSFWDNQTSGQPTSDGGTGKTTEEMMNISTFSGAGWNISLIASYDDEDWFINNTNDYPRLGWEWVLPPISISFVSPSTGSWQIENFTVTYEALYTDACKFYTRDGGAGSWVDRGVIGCGESQEVNISVGSTGYCTVQGSNECGVRIWANNTNEETEQLERSFSVDYTPPGIDPPVIYEGTRSGDESGSFFKDSVSLRSNISDSVSGIKSGSCRVNIDQGSWISSGVTQDSNYCYYNNYNPGQTFNIRFRVEDEAGNQQESSQSTFNYDDTPPTTTATAIKENTTNYEFNTWTNSEYINITLSCNDGSGAGCNATWYCTDTTNTCNPETIYTEPVQVSTTGTSYTRFRSDDELGNLESAKSETIRIDTEPPTVNLVSPANHTVTDNENASFTCNITDNIGIGSLTLNIWNSTNQLIITNTTNLTGTINETYWNVTFQYTDQYKWNCEGEDTAGNKEWSEQGNYTYIYAVFPQMETVRISPSPSAKPNENLLGYCNATHEDNNNVTYYYEWYVNSSLFESGSTDKNYTPGLEINVANISSDNTSLGEEWILSCQAYDGLVNSTLVNSSITTIFNNPPNNPDTQINTTDGSNTTLQDLNCYATITDPDGDNLNVSVKWYKNGLLHTEEDFNNSYPSGTSFAASLNSENTAKEDIFICSVQLFDGLDFSDWVNSTSLTIENTPPTQVTLIHPEDGDDFFTNRTPKFNWTEATDPDGDTITYGLQVSLNDNFESLLYNISGIPVNEYLLEDELDFNLYYWRVRGFDGEDYGVWSEVSNFTLVEYLDIVMDDNVVSFGLLQREDVVNTTGGSPGPFVFRNVGNVEADLVNTSVSESIWETEPLNTSYWMIKAREGGSFDEESSVTGWVNVSSYLSSLIVGLNYASGNDTGMVDIRVEVPFFEPPGEKNATIVFDWEVGG